MTVGEEEDVAVQRIMALGPQRDPDHAQSYRNERGLRMFKLDHLKDLARWLDEQPEHLLGCERNCPGSPDCPDCWCHSAGTEIASCRA